MILDNIKKNNFNFLRPAWELNPDPWGRSPRCYPLHQRAIIIFLKKLKQVIVV